MSLAALGLALSLAAGAARLAVTPDLARHSPIYIAGFGHNRVATGIHDELWARCLALDDGSGAVVMCGVDSIGLILHDVGTIRAEAKRRAPKIHYLLVAALHDHQAPDTMGLWGPAPLTSGIHDNRPPVVHDSELSVGGVARYPGAHFPDAPEEPAVKKIMSAPFRMLVGLANDEIGYLLPRAEWDEQPPGLQNAPKCWYGEVNSVGSEAAPLIVKQIVDLIRSVE